ncbi:tropomyosin [Populus alba x Populus x berolinensis]|uniref:Tropomyosin n=1 Tax=Populus alba x Populus x berolinensis TaxID=444605 RepID=A0AAD6R0C0_9ROSI|nr:tropomyosin [Populus alba x Populus x berolinensis]
MEAVYYYYYLLPFVFPAILSAVLGLSSQDHQNQLYEAKLRITQSESRLEEITQNINDRDRYLERCEDLIGELDHKLNHLQSVFSHLKVADDKIKDLEEEVRVLWATLRKNNFDIHVLESKAREAEDRLQMVTSQVEKVNPLNYCWFICFCSLQMEDIVSERWIQIQQFEQALQLKEIRLKAQRQASTPRWTFLKFFSYLSGEYLPNAHGLLSSHFSEESALRAYVSQAFSWLKRFYAIVKESHHELQVFVKQEMERHEFTACLANKEIVFFVASALITFPVLSAWILLSSQLC